eukprot:2683920-Prorocentrum_lima.AAC.1
MAPASGKAKEASCEAAHCPTLAASLSFSSHVSVCPILRSPPHPPLPSITMVHGSRHNVT